MGLLVTNYNLKNNLSLKINTLVMMTVGYCRAVVLDCIRFLFIHVQYLQLGLMHPVKLSWHDICASVKSTMSQAWRKAPPAAQSSLLSRTERWGFMQIFYSEEHFGQSDHFLPALTCCHSENKRRFQGNSQTIGSTAAVPIKRKRPERTGKAPTTPVKTHLEAQQIPLRTLTAQHHKVFCFYALGIMWEAHFWLHNDLLYYIRVILS